MFVRRSRLGLFGRVNRLGSGIPVKRGLVLSLKEIVAVSEKRGDTQTAISKL